MGTRHRQIPRRVWKSYPGCQTAQESQAEPLECILCHFPHYSWDRLHGTDPKFRRRQSEDGECESFRLRKR